MSTVHARIDEITKSLEEVITQAGMENGIMPGSPLHERALGLLADMKTSLDRAAEETLQEIKALEEEEKRRAQARKLRREDKLRAQQPTAPPPPPFGDGSHLLDQAAIKAAIQGLTADLHPSQDTGTGQDLWEE